MDEGKRYFEQSIPPTQNEVIDALSNITTVEKSRAAAKLLGQFLETIDTSKMSRIKKSRIEGIKTHCKKPEAEIDNPEHYIGILNTIFADENE